MTELLEDAIRAGVARGMDDAPVVPDLAERVRAVPSGSASRWKLLAVAAAAVVVALVSVGRLAASIPRQPFNHGLAPIPRARARLSAARSPARRSGFRLWRHRHRS